MRLLRCTNIGRTGKAKDKKTKQEPDWQTAMGDDKLSSELLDLKVDIVDIDPIDWMRI